MTIFEFNPRFHNEDKWSGASIDKESPWCLAISDCICHYHNRFVEIPCFKKYCEWPLTRYQFEKSWCEEYRKGFSIYEEYLANEPKVEYFEQEDCSYYGLKNTDGTLTFAYQNDEYIFIVHIKSGYYLDNASTPEGFGCIINKHTNEMHCVALGEDDGNYWGNYDIEFDKLAEFDWGIVSMVVNEMKSEVFRDKEALVEAIFNLVK